MVSSCARPACLLHHLLGLYLTVRRYRQSLWKAPQTLLELDLYEEVGSGKNMRWRCLVCAERMEGRDTVERHVLRHYLDEQTVAGALSLESHGTPQGEA